MLHGLSDKLSHYMDLLSVRQKLVASNIANVDTPGYLAKDIDFQFEYLAAMNGVAPDLIDSPGLKVKNDGNNVSMDRETRLLAENAMRFNVAQTLLKGEIKALRAAIQEGKG